MFDTRRRELRRGGTVIELRPQVEALLRLFLEQPSKLLSRKELTQTLWPAAVVTDDSLVQCVSELRTALRDHDHRFVRTVRGRGYRWECPLGSAGDDAVSTEAAGDAPLPEVAPAPAVLPAAPPRQRTAWRGWRPGRVAAILLVCSAAGMAIAYRAIQPALHIDDEMAALGTVAVMPFEIGSNDVTSAHFADLMADVVAAQFVNRAGLRSIGRSATAAFAKRPVNEAARELKARLVVRGQVTRGGGDQISVDVQLVSADGESLWTKHADLSPGDSAGRAVLGQQVANAARNRGRIGTAKLESSIADLPGPVQETILGWHALVPGASLDDIRQARARFEAATAADPSSLIARNGLAACYSMEATNPRGRLDARDIERYESLVERTRQMAPDDPTALLIWAQTRLQHHQAEAAIPAIERAIAISPSYANGYLILARAKLAAGRPEEVPALADKVVERGYAAGDRVSMAHVVAAEAALMAGRDDAEVASLAVRAAAEWPANPDAHVLMAAAEALDGHADRSRLAMKEAERLLPGDTVEKWLRRHPLPAADSYAEPRRRLAEALHAAGMPAQ